MLVYDHSEVRCTTVWDPRGSLGRALPLTSKVTTVAARSRKKSKSPIETDRPQQLYGWGDELGGMAGMSLSKLRDRAAEPTDYLPGKLYGEFVNSTQENRPSHVGA